MATPPDFTAGQVLTAAQMNAVGLWRVTDGTFTNTNNFTISGFTSDYEFYRVIIRATRVSGTGTNELNAQLYNGATARTTEYYGGGFFVNLSGGTGTVGLRNNLSDMWLGNVGSSGPSTSVFDCRGFTSSQFTVTGHAYDNQNVRSVTFAMLHNVSETNDSLRFAFSAANATGIYQVYGYN